MTTAERTADRLGGPLISGEELERCLSQEGVRVLDVRGRHPSSRLPHAKRAEYERSHIPGAVFVDWQRDLVAAEDPVPVQLADPDGFAGRAGQLGVGDGDLVVTYDDYYGIFASRVAWAFRANGAPARVLDGGWQTWVEEGRALSGESPVPRRASFSPAPARPLRRELAEVAQAGVRGAVLVDARPRHLFLGEPGVANSGHIPGSLCLPYQELVDGATGLWASQEATARLVRDAGIDPADPPEEVIATCGSGVSAAVAMFALERIGVPVQGLYDGSFNEWGADPGRAVEYGPAAAAQVAAGRGC